MAHGEDITLAGRTQPSPERTSTREAMSQSLAASALEAYLECPQRYFLEHVERRALPRSGARALALALRLALRDHYVALWQGEAARRDLLELFAQHFDGTACSDSWEEERLRRQGEEVLRRYEQSSAARPARLLGVDLAREHSVGPLQVCTTLDRLEEEPDGCLRAVLHRTAAPRSRPESEPRDVALTVIQASLQESSPEQLVRVEEHDVRQGIVRDVTKNRAALDGRLLELREAAARLAADEAFPPGDPARCRYCWFRRRCTARTTAKGS